MALQKLSCIFIFIVALISCDHLEQSNKTINSDKMMIRLSEIEIEPEYLEEYLSILKEKF